MIWFPIPFLGSCKRSYLKFSEMFVEGFVGRFLKNHGIRPYFFVECFFKFYILKNVLCDLIMFVKVYIRFYEKKPDTFSDRSEGESAAAPNGLNYS